MSNEFPKLKSLTGEASLAEKTAFLLGVEALKEEILKAGWKSPKEVGEVKVRGLEAGAVNERERIFEGIRDVFDEMFPPPLVKPEILLRLWDRLQALKDKP